LDNRAADHVLRIRDLVLAVDQRLWNDRLLESYRMLDHKGLPNFKITGMICGAVMLAGSLITFQKSDRRTRTDFDLPFCSFSC